MKPNQDAFGQMLYDQYQGIPAPEIIERDDGMIDTGSGRFHYLADYADWNPLEQEAMQYISTGRVLDIGCGAGRVALYLQSKSCAITGIDISPLAVEVCRLRGVKDARQLSITQVSRALGSFDTMVMMGNNWGLMGSFQRARWLLRKFYAMTTPQARIVACTLNPYATTDPVHTAYHERNRQRGRMGGQVRIRSRYRDITGAWFDYLFVSPEEMESILDGTGWKVSRYLTGEGAVYVAILEKI